MEQLHEITGPLLACWPVITEAAWLLRAHPRAIRRLLAFFESGIFQLLPLNETDTPGIAAILEKHKNLTIQLADACLVHLAGREGIEIVFTLDRRDFGVLRASRRKRLRIIP